MPTKPKIPFFTDQNVADSAGNFLKQCGHKLTRLRDCMATDTKDPLVALACANGGHVLVSHDNDFKQIAKKLNITKKQYRLKLHRLHLKCSEPFAAKRIGEAIKLIESEWQIAKRRDEPMVIEIYDKAIRIVR